MGVQLGTLGGGVPLGCGKTLWMNAAGQSLNSGTGANSCIVCTNVCV